MAAKSQIESGIVVMIVSNECGRFTHHSMDGLASDLIAGIWFKGTEFESETHLRKYVREAIRRHWMNQVRAYRRTKLFCELLGDEDDETEWLSQMLGAVRPNQECVVEVKRLRRLSRGWPMLHQKIFSILAEGGGVLDAAKELGMSPFDVIRFLREARTFVETGSSLEMAA